MSFHAKKIKKERERRIKAMPSWTEVIRGSLVKYRLTCGNKRCRCHRQKNYRHGPYWYVGVGLKGGRRQLYLISSEDKEKVKRGISTYHKLWEELCQISELNLRLIRRK